MISSLELARRCGISQGTVDRALHDRAGVNPETKERVLRIARQFGYRPHPAVRELLTGQSNVVGAILPTVNNVFFMDIFNELARALGEQGLQLQLTPAGNRVDFLKILGDFAARRYRMTLAIPPEENIRVPRNIIGSVPLLSLFSPCLGTGIPFLSPDEEQTGRDAVKYLHQRGHRRILHLTYARRAYAIAARTSGYQKQCRAMGLRSRVLVNCDAASLEQTLKRDQATALFCHNDWMALSVLLLLSEKGIRVPGDISVLGVDNSPTLTTLNPRLTTMAYPMADAVRAVMTFLGGKSATLEKKRHQIIERATVRNVT